MNDFSAHLKMATRIILILLFISLVAWAVFPAYRVYLSGLILGEAVGLINALHLAWRIHRLADTVLMQPNARKSSLGFATRAALALLAAFVAQKYGMNIIAMIAGLFSVQLATLILGIISTRKSNK